MADNNVLPEASIRKANGRYAKLYRKFSGLTLICSLVPLLIVGWGMNIHYTRFAKERMVESFRNHVDNHRKLIELFLEKNHAQLQLIANTHTRDYLSVMANLSHVFDMLNRPHRAVADLGVIDSKGRHLAYVGPFDLMDKNYAETKWFKATMRDGLYISDIFEGFRGVPHFVIAVTGSSENGKWIVRATIDTEAFRSLVETVRIGKTGEVYLLNREGIYQTNSRFHGRIMQRASEPMTPPHEDTVVSTVDGRVAGPDVASSRQIHARAWLRNPPWMLVVSQDYAEAFNDVNHANRSMRIFLYVSALSILFVAILITRHMIGIIKQRDREAALLNQQLLQAGKMASIGELSAGVAHEINNPLAIILTERQILLDQCAKHSLPDSEFTERLERSLCQIDVQVNRCKRITHSLLAFSRRTESVLCMVDLNGLIREIVTLVERDAQTDGIVFHTAFQEDLPSVFSDPFQLQQVFLNLITNSIDAVRVKPYGSIAIRTYRSKDGRGIEATVADTGTGISPEYVDRIFDPFFTTKPVGKGTGLGLSICYSILEKLGGNISVKSEPGQGTEFSLFLPFDLPAELKASIAQQAGAATGKTETRGVM